MIIFTPLWETMKKKGFTKYKLVHKHGIAQKTISKMVKNMPVSLGTINELCKILNCEVEDIIKFIDEK